MFQSLNLFGLSCLFLTATCEDLVQDVQCEIYTSTYTWCSWKPLGQQPLNSFYQKIINAGEKDDADSPPYEACSSCTNTNDGRDGCCLSGVKDFDLISMLFNRTQDNETQEVNHIHPQVKPPALNWTVIKDGDKFIINWTKPDIGYDWKLIINYTECNKNKKQDTFETSFVLRSVPHCQYSIKTKAEHSDRNWSTPWSTPHTFDPDTNSNSNVLVTAAIIIPLLIGSLAALLFVCWRKNKNSIFPKVPIPRDLLSDISDNNNKSNVPSLYIPAMEEENCKITLVVDPQNNKLDP